MATVYEVLQVAAGGALDLALKEGWEPFFVERAKLVDGGNNGKVSYYLRRSVSFDPSSQSIKSGRVVDDDRS